MHKDCWWGNLKEITYLQNQGVGASIEVNVKEMLWRGVDGIRVAQDRDITGCCEHGNEPLGSVKYIEFLGYPKEC
jgi:hypothetical protein